MATLKPQTLALTRVRRGVRDAPRSAEFYSWLLGAPAQQDEDRFVIECGNGELILDREVSDLGAVRERLRRVGVGYLEAPRDPVGERLYLDDPDGDPSMGSHNVELIEYAPGVPRSGRLGDCNPSEP